MNKLIDFVFKQRFLIIFAGIIVIIGGVFAWRELPIDAYPDVTNVQVMIITRTEGLATTEVERLVTSLIEIEMKGLPDVKMVRSLSAAGLSQVIIIFEDKVDIYFARQLVFERLQSVKEKLPVGMEPEMGPVSTGLGEIYQYTLESNSGDLTKLRTIQDWIIRPQLRSLSGVNDINSFGGLVKQYQVLVEPDKLLKYELTLKQVEEALSGNNSTASGNYIVKGSEQIVVRGEGLIKSIEDIENIVVEVHESVPIYIRDIARVQIGHEIRWGTATRDGKGETVCAMVIMLKDSNAKDVVERIKKEIPKIEEQLPDGVKIKPFYDRTELIKACINTVSSALFQGGILVILVLFLFLGDFRTASIVCLSLPLSSMICFIVMKFTGLTANLMSLGGLAIAIGMIVDGNIVVSENIFRHLTENKESKNVLPTCMNAVKEVATPVMFAILIIIIVFLPLFTLEQIEGKMFKPLALTLMIVMAASLLVSMTITPILGSMFIKGGKQEDNASIRFIKKLYLPALNLAIKYKKATALSSVIVFLTSIFLFKYIGTEFLPYLDEGSIALNVTRYPTVSLEESKNIGTMIEQMLLEFHEVKTVVTKTGRPEIAEDPMGPEKSDVFIMLNPKKSWKAKSKKELLEKMNKKLSRIPGIKLNFSQPIALKVNELISGIKSDIAVKVFGYDLELLRQKGEEIEAVLNDLQGANDVKLEQITGFLQMDITVDRKAISRYGINVNEVNEVIETAVGGKIVSQIFEEDKRFNLFIRFAEEKRKDEETIGNILISASDGKRIPLRQLADIKIREGVNQISRENGSRRIVIECNVRDRDIGSFVQEAKDKIQKIKESLPAGYYIEWGGQFENQERAMKRLSIVVPVVIVLIFIMLFSTFGAIRPAVLVILNLPFSIVGGIAAILLLNINLSISAVIGFITLFGTAVENGIVLVSFFIELRKEGLSLNQAIIKGCELRLRPLLLTTLTTILGLVPLLWATGAGADIQKPLAVVVLGGLVSSCVLTLIVLPAIYGWFVPPGTPAGVRRTD